MDRKLIKELAILILDVVVLVVVVVGLFLLFK